MSSAARSLLGACLVAVLASCDGGPKITALELTRNPNPAVPMAAVLELRTDRETRVEISIRDDYDVVTEHAFDGWSSSHEMPLIGFRAGRAHEVRVTVTDRSDATASATRPFVTAPLPVSVPPVQVRMLRRARMEPGITLVPLIRGTLTGPDRTFGLVLMVDDHGEIVWWYQTDHTVSFTETTERGTLLYVSGTEGRMFEIDLLGNVLRRWHTTGIEKDGVSPDSLPIETDSLHHELARLANGNLLTLSSELRHFESFPSSETDPAAPPAPADVVGDVIVELTEEGRIERQWSLIDVIDPTRVSPGSLGKVFWGGVYEGAPIDYSHTNSVVHDAGRGSFLISMNGQSAVFEMDTETNEVRWIIARLEGWNERLAPRVLRPIGPIEWPSNQHSAVRTPAGTILMYDNGRHRAPPYEEAGPEEEKYSRVVEYEIDEEAMTVRQVFDYGSLDGHHFYSEQLCDVKILPRTGNYHVTDGARVHWVAVPEEVRSVLEEAGRTVPDALPHMWLRIFELTRSEPVERVFEIVVDEPQSLWSCYRSRRYPDVYLGSR